MTRVEIHGDDIEPLLAWLAESDGTYRSMPARLVRRPDVVGALSVQTTHGHDKVRHVARVRKKRRVRNQYATVHRLDDLELKIGDRYVPAREAIARHPRGPDGSWVRMAG